MAAAVTAPGTSSTASAAEKTDTWLEVRSPHFTVATNASEKQARRVANQFEQIRAAFQKTLVNIRVDPGEPIFILAAKNENTLKALLPEYWEVKGHMHPAGLFVPGQEKHYVALRLDAEGENPYHILYHEYVHLLVRLNFRNFPVWLNEGYAEFFGNTRIGDKELIMGEASRAHIQQLRESKLLPLEILLKVDHRSPYYNEATKSSIFYAQSWAMVHYLMLDDKMRKEQPLVAFGRLLANDVDEVEAARRAFGDLKQFEKTVESYVRQSSFHYYLLKSPAETPEKDFLTRSLAPAESVALRGDFHLHTRRPAEARALLEEALRLDPNLALAHESMGFLHFQMGAREEAAKWLARAVKLDSRSYLAHYYHAMLMLQGSPQSESFAEAEASLRRAIELNANFAPAHSTLAMFYSLRKETLEQALAAARRAVELEPGELRYYLDLGGVLLRMDRADEASLIGQRVLAAARSPEIRAATDAFLEELSRYREYLAQRKRYEEEARASREQLQSYLRADAAAGHSKNPEPPPEASRPAQPSSVASTRLYSSFGRITEVTCSSPTAMNLTLNLGGMVMRLRAPNYFKIEYLTTAWKPPANFNPCLHLKGLSAKLSYTLAQAQDYDGEIVSIEVRKQTY